MEPSAQIAAEAARVRVRPGVLVPLFVLVSGVGGALPSFSLGANLLVLATGGVLFWLGVTARAAVPAAPPRDLSGAAGWWLLPALGLAAVEAVTYLLGSTAAYPTLSRLVDPVLEGYLARCAAYFGWLSAFWALVRR